MNKKLKNFTVITLTIFSIVILMILSNEYARDRIFGANLIFWPLSYLIITIIGLKRINNSQGYCPNFFKSVIISLITAIASSVLFAFYWIYKNNFEIEMLIGATKMSLPINLILAVIIGVVYRNKN